MNETDIAMNAIDTIIFDLGGVFIRLTGVDQMLEWTSGRLSVDELWEIWFSSEYVRGFETGSIDAQAFARGIIREYRLTVEENEFLDRFTSWASELYPGTRRLLSQLKPHYTLACLSNINEIHWDNLCRRFCIDQYFHRTFPSHLIGRIKPEIETFSYVIGQLDSPPERIVFFDDNPDNVKTARQTGIHAFQVEGVDGLSRELVRLNLINI